MSLYLRDIQRQFGSLEGTRIRTELLQPRLLRSRHRLANFVAIHVSFRRALRMAVKRARLSGARVTCHILDQHYSHLHGYGDNNVVTCHDLNIYRSVNPNIKDVDIRRRTAGLGEFQTIHAISRNTYDDVVKYFPKAVRRIEINYYGIDEIFLAEDDVIVPEVMRLPDRSCLKLLHVGSNIPRKNMGTLLAALPRIKVRLLESPYRDVVLFKIGSSLMMDGFADQIDALGIRANIVHVGSVPNEELKGYYRGSDIFVFPSSYEGFGRPIAEAQAAGTPCVVARSSCLPDIAGDAALLHATESPEDLADKVCELASSDQLRAKLRKKGKLNVKRFSWSNHCSKLIASYVRASQAGS